MTPPTSAVPVDPATTAPSITISLPTTTLPTTHAAVPTTAAPTSRRQPFGPFSELAFRLTDGVNTAVTGCALAALTLVQQQQGLTGRSDLGGYDAMLFVFSADVSFPFTMEGVPVPLSIAWFDAQGRLVDRADMPVCPSGGCTQLHRSRLPYRVAIETLAGGLDRLAIGPGRQLEVGGACAV